MRNFHLDNGSNRKRNWHRNGEIKGLNRVNLASSGSDLDLGCWKGHRSVTLVDDVVDLLIDLVTVLASVG